MRKLLFEAVENEVADFLAGLIKINTTNPPGNETAAARYVAESLKQDGFECEIFESSVGRGSVVTRLKGTSNNPGLLLLSHLDVVAAKAGEWSTDPFGGIIRDGFVWGRGALDMKGMTAIEVMALKLLKRNNVKLGGSVILAATADEERGGEAGAGWLVQKHPDKVCADYVLNEGGGMAMRIDRKTVFTLNTAEKGILWFKIKAGGTPGHGSVPGSADNAILRMNKVIDRLNCLHQSILLIPTVKQYLNELAKYEQLHILSTLLRNPEKSDKVLDKLSEKDKYLAEEIRARLRTTMTPTIVQGGVKENIIPSECEAIFDCRVLPGQSPKETLAQIKKHLKNAGLDKLTFEIIQASKPSESPLDTPLRDQIVTTMKEFKPGSHIIPTMLTGGTDSRFFRNKGSVCYGFHPIEPETSYSRMQETIHGIDERISTRNLVFGTSVLYDIIEKFMAKNRTNRNSKP